MRWPIAAARPGLTGAQAMAAANPKLPPTQLPASYYPPSFVSPNTGQPDAVIQDIFKLDGPPVTDPSQVHSTKGGPGIHKNVFDTGERYDCVIVGGGATQRRDGEPRSIGTWGKDGPSGIPGSYGQHAVDFLAWAGVDFTTATKWQGGGASGISASYGLYQRLLFPAGEFGQDSVVAARNAGPFAGQEPATVAGWTAFLARTPYSAAARAGILRVQTAAEDFLANAPEAPLSPAAKRAYLTAISYKQYVRVRLNSLVFNVEPVDGGGYSPVDYSLNNVDGIYTYAGGGKGLRVGAKHVIMACESPAQLTFTVVPNHPDAVRWSYGYAHELTSTFDPSAYGPVEKQPQYAGRQPFKNVSIANSDSEGSPTRTARSTRPTGRCRICRSSSEMRGSVVVDPGARTARRRWRDVGRAGRDHPGLRARRRRTAHLATRCHSDRHERTERLAGPAARTTVRGRARFRARGGRSGVAPRRPAPALRLSVVPSRARPRRRGGVPGADDGGAAHRRGRPRALRRPRRRLQHRRLLPGAGG